MAWRRAFLICEEVSLVEEMVEKKPGVWNKLRESKMRQVIFFVVIMVALIAIYLPCMKLVQTVRTNALLRSERTNEDVKTATHVEKVDEKGKLLEIFGWAIRVDSTVLNGRVILQPVDGSEAKVLKTSQKKRSEIGNKIEANWNVGMNGFVAEIDRDKLKENVCYEVLYAFDYEIGNVEENKQTSTKVSTKQYVYNGQLYYFNPQEYMKPDILDGTIQPILEKGRVCGFDIDKEIWVYQYQDNLYVIVGNDLYMEWEGNIEIPYHLWTTHNDKLPENRVQNGFDNRDFRFVNNEISISSEKYHVAIASIPQEYPIMNIRIGIFDSKNSEWVWRVDFLPEIN